MFLLRSIEVKWCSVQRNIGHIGLHLLEEKHSRKGGHENENCNPSRKWCPFPFSSPPKHARLAMQLFFLRIDAIDQRVFLHLFAMFHVVVSANLPFFRDDPAQSVH